jgi:hypothetical protein
MTTDVRHQAHPRSPGQSARRAGGDARSFAHDRAARSPPRPACATAAREDPLLPQIARLQVKAGARASGRSSGGRGDGRRWDPRRAGRLIVGERLVRLISLTGRLTVSLGRSGGPDLGRPSTPGSRSGSWSSSTPACAGSDALRERTAPTSARRSHPFQVCGSRACTHTKGTSTVPWGVLSRRSG